MNSKKMISKGKVYLSSFAQRTGAKQPNQNRSRRNKMRADMRAMFNDVLEKAALSDEILRGVAKDVAADEAKPLETRVGSTLRNEKELRHRLERRVEAVTMVAINQSQAILKLLQALAEDVHTLQIDNAAQLELETETQSSMEAFHADLQNVKVALYSEVTEIKGHISTNQSVLDEGLHRMDSAMEVLQRDMLEMKQDSKTVHDALLKQLDMTRMDVTSLTAHFDKVRDDLAAEMNRTDQDMLHMHAKLTDSESLVFELEKAVLQLRLRCGISLPDSTSISNGIVVETRGASSSVTAARETILEGKICDVAEDLKSLTSKTTLFQESIQSQMDKTALQVQRLLSGIDEERRQRNDRDRYMMHAAQENFKKFRNELMNVVEGELETTKLEMTTRWLSHTTGDAMEMKDNRSGLAGRLTVDVYDQLNVLETNMSRLSSEVSSCYSLVRETSNRICSMDAMSSAQAVASMKQVEVVERDARYLYDTVMRRLWELGLIEEPAGTIETEDFIVEEE